MARLADAKHAGFYPLMLLIERLARDRTPIGTDGSPATEGVRFRHDPSLAFNPGDVLDVQSPAAKREPESLESEPDIYEITTTFLGLTGSASPLPSYFLEELLQEESDRTRDFLDIFHHRLVSLLYRAQSRCDLPNNWLSDGSDVWSRRLLALVGFGVDAPARLPRRWLLRFLPLLNDGEVTAAALESMLADVLGPDLGNGRVVIEQFVGTWADLEHSELTRLGRNGTRLGRSFLLGSRVFDRAGKFRVVVGPLGRDAYDRFGEDGELLRRIERVISTILSGALEYEVVLWLERDAAPSLRLSSSGRTRLGTNSWLGRQSREVRITVPVPQAA